MTAFDLDGAFTIGGGGTFAYPTIASLAAGVENVRLASRSPRAAWRSEHRLRLRIVDLYAAALARTRGLRAPVPTVGIMVDSSQGPTACGSTWNSSASTDVASYNVYRGSSGAGPFNLVNVDPGCAHAVPELPGLSPTTTYYTK